MLWYQSRKERRVKQQQSDKMKFEKKPRVRYRVRERDPPHFAALAEARPTTVQEMLCSCQVASTPTVPVGCAPRLSPLGSPALVSPPSPVKPLTCTEAHATSITERGEKEEEIGYESFNWEAGAPWSRQGQKPANMSVQFIFLFSHFWQDMCFCRTVITARGGLHAAVLCSHSSSPRRCSCIPLSFCVCAAGSLQLTWATVVFLLTH